MKDDLGKHRLNLPSTDPSSAKRLSSGEAQEKRNAIVERYAVRGLAVIALDCSSSMDREAKIGQARRGAREFAAIAIASRYDVGLVFFNELALVGVERTQFLDVIAKGVDKAVPSGTTNMAGALTLASTLMGNAKPQAIVLVTDGYPDDQQATLNAAAQCKERGIDIIVVGTTDADLTFLRQLASRSDLASVHSNAELGAGIAGAALLLPKPGKG